MSQYRPLIAYSHLFKPARMDRVFLDVDNKICLIPSAPNKLPQPHFYHYFQVSARERIPEFTKSHEMLFLRHDGTESF